MWDEAQPFSVFKLILLFIANGFLPIDRPDYTSDDWWRRLTCVNVQNEAFPPTTVSLLTIRKEERRCVAVSNARLAGSPVAPAGPRPPRAIMVFHSPFATHTRWEPSELIMRGHVMDFHFRAVPMIHRHVLLFFFFFSKLVISSLFKVPRRQN